MMRTGYDKMPMSCRCDPLPARWPNPTWNDLARLSYGRALALPDQHTAVGGASGTGWDLHDLLMLMAKSRHRKAENVRRYFHPSPEAIAELTSLLAPGDTRR